MEKEIIKKISWDPLPTAARALLPKNRPTTMESTVLYSCWSRFPRIRGIEKINNCFQMEPEVIRSAEPMARTSQPSSIIYRSDYGCKRIVRTPDWFEPERFCFLAMNAL